jgi:hypothetical protein
MSGEQLDLPITRRSTVLCAYRVAAAKITREGRTYGQG